MTKACANCGQLNPPEAAFCLNCSRSITSGPNPGAPPPFQNAVVGGHAGNAPAGSAGQKAMIALGLAVAALFCCGPLTGIPAAIVGWMELSAIKDGRSPASGRWMAMVGIFGGIAATILHVVFYMLGVLSSLLSAASDPYGY